jgi:hypothetical protein
MDCPPSFARPPVGRPGFSGGRPGSFSGGRTGSFSGSSFSGGRTGSITGSHPTFTGGRTGNITGLPAGFTGGRTGTFTGSSFTGGTGGFSGGRLGTPIMPQRSPAEVTAGIRRAIDTSPRNAFNLLRNPETRILGEAARLTLGREALQKLALKVETGGNATNNLTEVRAARRSANDLPAELRTGLDRLTAQAERVLLSEGIREVSVRAERGNWGEATRKANDWLGRLSKPELADAGRETAEFKARWSETRDTLKEVADVGKRLDSLNRIETALKTKEAQPGERARKLDAIDTSGLPPRLKQQVEGLRGLAEVKARANEKWTRAPNVAEIKDSVARMERGLSEVPGRDATLGDRLLQDLAVKAFLEGHPAEYFKLRPEEGPAEHAANLLRDLKALALGEGKVETWAGGSALPAEPGKGPGSPRAPPGLEPLIPEGAREGWRPPVKESAAADLPALEKAVELGATLEANAEAGIQPERKALQTKGDGARQKLDGVYQRIIAPELAERRQFSELETQLDRSLRPLERVQVRTLLAQNQSPQQIVATLQKQQGGEDEETEFLADVAKHLRTPQLSVEQKARALRLRRSGRTAAEVADLLRA